MYQLAPFQNSLEMSGIVSLVSLQPYHSPANLASIEYQGLIWKLSVGRGGEGGGGRMNTPTNY